MVAMGYVTEQRASTIANWREDLKLLLKSVSSINSVALVGVGHPFRGDDYAGSLIVKTLAKHVEKVDGMYLLDAEDNIEGIISKLAQIAPKQVIFIDACEMKMKPGEMRLIPIGETSYPFFTTHGIPLKLLAGKFLPRSKTWVLAIQPESLELADHLSTKVDETSISVIEFIESSLREAEHTNV